MVARYSPQGVPLLKPVGRQFLVIAQVIDCHPQIVGRFDHWQKITGLL
jgi:hypothetical protein